MNKNMLMKNIAENHRADGLLTCYLNKNKVSEDLLALSTLLYKPQNEYSTKGCKRYFGIPAHSEQMRQYVKLGGFWTNSLPNTT